MIDTAPRIHRSQRSSIRSETAPQPVVPVQPPTLHSVSLAAAPPALLAISTVSRAGTTAAVDGGRAASVPTLRHPGTNAAEKQNERSAALVELVGRVLIEKMFFQHLHIPQDVLLSLMNNVIQTVAPEPKTKIDLYQEGAILYKQVQGKALSPEEQRYEDALKEIDVPGEILNGIKYSAMALMGSNLCTSISSAVNHGLWSHVPAIMGYTGAIAFGPKLIQAAVEKALAYSGLTAGQKKLLTPWLNTLGRLALGFMPKVSANEQGVHYRRPSVEGHTSIVTSQGSVTLTGENGMHFKLHGIREITQDKITLTVMNEAGKKIAVEFAAVQNDLENGISVRSSDKNLEGYWNQEIRSVLPAMQTKDLSCQSALAIGAVASTVGQNALPALIATLSCWPKVSAFGEIENELGASTSKRVVMQQQFPAIFDLNSLDGTNGFVLPGVSTNGRLGSSVSTAGDINGDGILDLVLGAYGANAGLGASYVIFGSRSPFSTSFNLTQLNGTNGFSIPGIATSGGLGNSVSSAGDINGDNITDLVLGASGANAGLGASYVIFGSRSPFPAFFNLTQLNGANGFSIPGVATSGGLGNSVSSAGDINGDNLTDLVLGAAYVNPNLVGASYVIFGSRSPFPDSFNLTQLNGTNGFTIPGVAANGQLGYSVNSAGDINGDNLTDLVLGAVAANATLGASYVIFGSRSPFPIFFSLTQLNGTNGFTIPGVVANGYLGNSVSSAGDINGDNITDLVLGARNANAALGASYVIFGSRNPFPAFFSLTQLNGTNGFTIPGVAANGAFGVSVSSAGDINGDNITDLALGAYLANANLGASYVIFGSRNPFPAFFSLAQLNGTNGFSIPGIAGNGNLGSSISSAGDINGDNLTDLVLGAAGANAGLDASYVIFGQNTSTRILTPTPTPALISSPLTPCPIAQPLTPQNNAIQINQAQTLRLTPNDLSASCGNNTAPNPATLFNITGISHAQFKTRNSNGTWNNASSFLGNDLSQGRVELIQDNSTLAPKINFTITDGQTTLPETAANVQFSTSAIAPTVTAIDFDIQKNGTTTLTPQQFQIISTTTQLDNVVISVTSVENGYFTSGNSSAPISDFTYYQVQDAQIQFAHNGTQLPNMTLTVSDGSGMPVAFTPLVHFFNTDNPANPAAPVEAVVGGAIGAVAVTAAVGVTALGIIKYRQHKEDEAERNHQTPDLKSVANPLQMPATH